MNEKKIIAKKERSEKRASERWKLDEKIKYKERERERERERDRERER